MTTVILVVTPTQGRILVGHDGQVVAQTSWELGRDVGGELIQHLSAVVDKVGYTHQDIDRYALASTGNRFGALRSGALVASLLAVTNGQHVVTIPYTTDDSVLIQTADTALPQPILRPDYTVAKE